MSSSLQELRLLLEELLSELCRFRHMVEGGLPPEALHRARSSSRRAAPTPTSTSACLRGNDFAPYFIEVQVRRPRR